MPFRAQHSMCSYQGLPPLHLYANPDLCQSVRWKLCIFLFCLSFLFTKQLFAVRFAAFPCGLCFCVVISSQQAAAARSSKAWSVAQKIEFDGLRLSLGSVTMRLNIVELSYLSWNTIWCPLSSSLRRWRGADSSKFNTPRPKNTRRHDRASLKITPR